MKLHGVMMVRNEADIIEASVRHNLSSLDRLTVIDHGSFDGSTEILRQLSAEDARLEVIADPSIEYRQSEITTSHTRALIEQGADFVFPLDADEFLKLPSRTKLETVLLQLPPAMHGLLHWQTYVPDDFAAAPAVFSPAVPARRRSNEPYPIKKVVVARHLKDRPRDEISIGNHMVLDIDHPGVMPRHALIQPQIAAVAHVPIRSRRQFEKKIVIGYLAYLAAHGPDSGMAFHWREAYEAIRGGESFDHGRLREIACNYGLKKSDWQPVKEIELVDDPIGPAGELRYRASADFGTLQLLMRFCERLVTEHPRPVASTSNDAG